jgi:hypothetical protein
MSFFIALFASRGRPCDIRRLITYPDLLHFQSLRVLQATYRGVRITSKRISVMSWMA